MQQQMDTALPTAALSGIQTNRALLYCLSDAVRTSKWTLRQSERSPPQQYVSVSGGSSYVECRVVLQPGPFLSLPPQQVQK